jgi:hypothetical protein
MFEKASRSWDELVRHRTFLAAARDAAKKLAEPARDELLEHLKFAERKLEAGDPLGDPGHLLPKVGEPNADELQPLLDGWIPHGPEEGRR